MTVIIAEFAHRKQHASGPRSRKTPSHNIPSASLRLRTNCRPTFKRPLGRTSRRDAGTKTTLSPQISSSPSRGANLAQREERPPTAAGTMLAHLPPGGRRGYVRAPERPRAALAGPFLIDLAGAALAMEEDAIAAGQLDQALADAHLADVAALELVEVEADGGGQGGDLRLVDPHIARRAGATRAALCTGTASRLDTRVVRP